MTLDNVAGLPSSSLWVSEALSSPPDDGVPMANAVKYFAEQAKFIRRDIRNGSYTLEELPEVIAGIWRDDEDELRSAYGIQSFIELNSGIRKALPTKRQSKKAPSKKAAKKKIKKAKRKSSWWPW